MHITRWLTGIALALLLSLHSRYYYHLTSSDG